MDIEMVKFDSKNYGWDIVVNVILTGEEISNCNMEPLEHVGDYEITHNGNTISFACAFDRNELWENETIDERLELIKKDIANLAKSCLKEK